MRTKQTTYRFWNQQQKIAPYLFIAPFYILFVVFMGYPLVSSLVMSLYEMRGFQSRIFVGIGNFIDLFGDPIFWKSLRNTAYFAAGTLTLQLPIALLLAILLNSKFVRGKNILRLAFFAPVLVAGVFVAIIFNLVYDQRAGLVNEEFIFFGKEIGWLNEENYVMPAVILTGVWQWAGFNMIYFLAGLQGIRQELYEAAAVDGANWWQAFLHVTLPSLRPVIAFVFVVSMIGSLQLFDLPYILTNGGEPADAGSTIVMYLYKNGFQFMRLGYAATIGWVLFFIIAVISIVQLKLLGIFRDE
ncbi:sugar ABC transporter permease [Candidatus Poribacteria bacterium]|nr:sugar ABC transporter permease [Candidatus Poribacteria bacterium]MYK18770.1 sugar ABC transporter permease [Candidatus Poribacteria bacterium]